MNLGLTNKRALVFGASSGLGRAVAATLVQEGAKVALVSRNQDRLSVAAREVGAHACIQADLTEPGAGARVTEAAIAKLGGLDILVCNAGGPPKGGLFGIDEAQWEQNFHSLFMSVVTAVRAAAPAMQQRQWGRIIVLTSTSAKEALPDMNISNAFRAGLLGLMKSLSNELAASGITVNALLPGYIETDRLRELGVRAEGVKHLIPAGRIGRPDEFAAVAAFLASEQASYVSGQALAVDGGRLKGF